MGKKKVDQKLLNKDDTDSDDSDKEDTHQDHKADKEVVNGPKGDRKVTDFLCCVVFLATTILCIVLSIKGYSEGNFDKLIAPIDADNNLCGFDTGFEDYPYLYIFDIDSALSSDNIFEYGVCVTSCPTGPDDDSWKCIDTTISEDTYDYPGGCQDFSNPDGDTTTDFFGYCLPSGDDRTAIYDEITNVLSDLGFSFLLDIETCQWTIYLGCVTSVLFTLFYMWLMHKYSKCLTWGVVVAFEALIVGSGIYSFQLASQEDDDSISDKYTWFAYGLFAIGAIYACVVMCWCKSLNLAIHLMDAAADFVIDNTRTVWVPISFFFISLAFFVVWFIGFLCICSTGNITSPDGLTQTKTIVWADQTYYEVYFMVFSAIWGLCFLMACSQFVIIVAACTWFWSWKDTDGKGGEEGDGDANISQGYHWCWRYHLGSLAYGSFLLAVVWAVQIIFEWFKSTAKKSAGSENALVKCLLNCISYYIECLKKCVKYLNENAYIELALRSENFCTCAKDGVCLIIKHGARFLFTSGLGRAMGNFAKLAVCAGNCFFIYILLENWSINEGMISPVGPLVVVLIFTWVTSDIFIGIFSIAADTFLHCFIMEEDICQQDGHHRSREMPSNLDQFIKGNVKKGADDDDDD